jgi:transcriptional regulator with XRE-family HTH domain
MRKTAKTKALGAMLRELRNSKGLRLDDVAPKIGTDAGSLSRIERGHRDPSLSQLRTLAALYGVAASSLVDLPPSRAA